MNLSVTTGIANLRPLPEDAHEVIYTHVKHVKKSKVPGQVYLAQFKTLTLKIEPERLAALLQKSDP